LENLVKDACFGKRIGTAEIGLAQHAELARVEAIEAPHPGDAIGAYPILRPILLAIFGGGPFATRAFACAASLSASSICASRHGSNLG
jgi:hypothetical protein